ncbi:MAG TPA: flippase [Dongiaceae bacterium]|nr:flippase [Dongiaceae bacterium]
MTSVEIPALPLIRPTFHVRGRTIARNTLLNIVGQLAPLAVGIVTTPYVIHRLGPDRYGLLALVWIVVGYFALFDLGIGPATTKFVAELLGQGRTEDLPAMVWTALATQTGTGLVAGLILAAASPTLVNHLLKIPPALRPEALWVFFILAASFPLNFATGSLRGVLAAFQRFDLVNAVGVPTAVLWFALPAAALVLGLGLPGIVLLLVISRVVALAAHFVFCLRICPALAHRCAFDCSLIRRLLGFGGWVSVTATLNPILIYLERLFIGALLSVAALAYYTPAYMISNRLGILPGSLAATLFPAFSASAGRGDGEWIRNALVRSLKCLILILGPAVLMLIFFARPILTLWVGPRFAAEGTLALQILAIGVFADSLNSVPYNLLQSLGRPDLTAKFRLAEAPLYAGLAWFMVTRFGLPGAAAAWSIRLVVDFLLLIVAACWLTRTPGLLLARKDLLRTILTLACLGGGLMILWASSHALTTDACFALLLGVGFLLACWHYALDSDERWQIKGWLRADR